MPGDENMTYSSDELAECTIDDDVSLSLSLNVGCQQRTSAATSQEQAAGRLSPLTSRTTTLLPQQTNSSSLVRDNTTPLQPLFPQPNNAPLVLRPARARRIPLPQAAGGGGGPNQESRSNTVPVLYPWATNRRAKVHNLGYLLAFGITTIKGTVQCKKCERQYELEYDLLEKFQEVSRYIAENRRGMHDRAPSVWMSPVLPTCRYCHQLNSAKPLIPEKKREINWLFLLLGQMLGCLTLDQLKYFCKHTGNHRTGAKDRVLYLAYLGMCRQLDPSGPFDRSL